MSIIKATEKIANPLQKSALNKKGLCDYVVNVASGCLHGCTFCYVPSTPAIRTKQAQLREQGVNDPQMDWGQYLFVREEIPEQLAKNLTRKTSWHETPEGKGVVLLCSGTDPYQNKQTANVTRGAVKALLQNNKRIRILTRSPLWLNDIDILKNPNVVVGMSLPYLSDELSRQIEPNAPLPSERYKALIKGYEAGCRLYVAVAPTPPSMTLDDFKKHLYEIMKFNPEVIFWEPINARGTNGKRMIAAGLEFTTSIMTRHSWAEYFKRQWNDIEEAAQEVGCLDRLHIWPDPELRGYVDDAKLDSWLYRPTVEKWDNPKISTTRVKSIKSVRKTSQLAMLTKHRA
ncbi:MAG: radical SAM protein [Aphanizomenon flos-aquae KM1D3_PB]|uniref:SPL family radical SAM protein n=1 Tax=Aphanizomenon flos-aquae TaxID=1176 RepID=UPI0005439284|nr:radical SAM protein [Aphanizomenon flos-aquae]KHG42160.1 radical SAM protein [Aphanizomenon flos-aquae 2012/KM1/D3]QSV74009.1 MAG: radical SAM protein [Aphanizomenon flos-aquae KM1D3_PB]